MKISSLSKLRARREELAVLLDRLSARKKSLDCRLDAAAKELERVKNELMLANVARYASHYYPPTGKETMATSKLISQALERQDLNIRRAFFRLSEEHKTIVEDGFRKHVMICRKMGLPHEQTFLAELIRDVKSGIHFKEEALTK